MIKNKVLLLLAAVSGLSAITYTVDLSTDTPSAMGGEGMSSGATSGELRWVLNQINQFPAASDDIVFSFIGDTTITLSAPLPFLNKGGVSSLTTLNGSITGGDLTISGANTHPGLFVNQGTVMIQNITINSCMSRGGNGGTGNSGGGGGPGIGGSLFIWDADVTLENVNIANSQVVGGLPGTSTFVSTDGSGGGGGLWGARGGDGGFTSGGGGGGLGIGGDGGDATGTGGGGGGGFSIGGAFTGFGGDSGMIGSVGASFDDTGSLGGGSGGFGGAIGGPVGGGGGGGAFVGSMFGGGGGGGNSGGTSFGFAGGTGSFTGGGGGGGGSLGAVFGAGAGGNSPFLGGGGGGGPFGQGGSVAQIPGIFGTRLGGKGGDIFGTIANAFVGGGGILIASGNSNARLRFKDTGSISSPSYVVGMSILSDGLFFAPALEFTPASGETISLLDPYFSGPRVLVNGDGTLLLDPQNLEVEDRLAFGSFGLQVTDNATLHYKGAPQENLSGEIVGPLIAAFEIVGFVPTRVAIDSGARLLGNGSVRVRGFVDDGYLTVGGTLEVEPGFMHIQGDRFFVPGGDIEFLPGGKVISQVRGDTVGTLFFQ